MVDFHHRGDAVALNIKDRETEQLAAEVAALAGESKTRAVKVALQERRARLAVRGGARDRHADFVRFLETEVFGLPGPRDRPQGGPLARRHVRPPAREARRYAEDPALT